MKFWKQSSGRRLWLCIVVPSGTFPASDFRQARSSRLMFQCCRNCGQHLDVIQARTEKYDPDGSYPSTAT
jgi:hypothetical protein